MAPGHSEFGCLRSGHQITLQPGWAQFRMGTPWPDTDCTLKSCGNLLIAHSQIVRIMKSATGHPASDRSANSCGHADRRPRCRPRHTPIDGRLRVVVRPHIRRPLLVPWWRLDRIVQAGCGERRASSLGPPQTPILLGDVATAAFVTQTDVQQPTALAADQAGHQSPRCWARMRSNATASRCSARRRPQTMTLPSEPCSVGLQPPGTGSRQVIDHSTRYHQGSQVRLIIGAPSWPHRRRA